MRAIARLFRTPAAQLCALSFLGLAALAVPSAAQEAQPSAGVTVTGAVQHSGTLTAQDLAALPAVNVPISFMTDHGQESATYTGALLWTVVQNSGLVNAAGRGAKLRHVISVTGRDGYSVALSLGEIDPDFEGKSVILAYQKDGKPLDPAMGIRLIVPGDHHGGRAVRDVVKVEVA